MRFPIRRSAARRLQPAPIAWFCGIAIWTAMRWAPPLNAGPLEADIHRAIDRGISFLLDAIESRQVEGEDFPDGRIAFESYALVVAGVSPAHPVLRKNFTTLSRMPLTQTYTVSCYALLLDAAISQEEGDLQLSGSRPGKDAGSGGEHRERLRKAIDALLKIKQPNKGCWNYDAVPGRYDNSNTQFAVLGLGAGAKNRIPIPDSTWEEVARHFIETQAVEGPEVQGRLERNPPEDFGDGKKVKIKLGGPDEKRPAGARRDGESSPADDREKTRTRARTSVGLKAIPEIGDEGLRVLARGWQYNPELVTFPWNMTCAGLSSLIVASRQLHGKVPAELSGQVNKAIRDGYGWLMKNWQPESGSYYGIYSLEKVADLNEIRKFAGHDWYGETADFLVRRQAASGAWEYGSGNASQVRENTAFALLVLNRATTLLLEARRPLAQRIASTGVRHPGADKEAQDWVYIRSLDRELHMPSFFRMLRLRPSPKIFQFAQAVFQDYPPEKKALLIPLLIRTVQEARQPGLQKAMQEELQKIAGTRYPRLEDYSRWMRRWLDLDAIGSQSARQEIPILMKYYRHTRESLPLREKVIWALMRCQAREAAGMLFDDLSHEDAGIRGAAYNALRSMAWKEPPPAFNAAADKTERVRQLGALKEWLDRVK